MTVATRESPSSCVYRCGDQPAPASLRLVLLFSGLVIDAVKTDDHKIVVGQPVTDLPDMKQAVSDFVSRVTQKLRKQQSVVRSVHVFFNTSPYRKHDRQHAPAITMPLARPTADTPLVIAAAVRAVDSVFRPEYNYVKAGVMLTDLQPEGREQGELDLFDAEPEPPSGADRPGLVTAIEAPIAALHHATRRGRMGQSLAKPSPIWPRGAPRPSTASA